MLHTLFVTDANDYFTRKYKPSSQCKSVKYKVDSIFNRKISVLIYHDKSGLLNSALYFRIATVSSC